MVNLWDDFWIQKGESGKGRKKDGAKIVVAKIQSCQNHFQSPTHIPSAHALTLSYSMMDGWDGRDSWVAAFLYFYVHRAFNTPETVITLCGIAVNCIVDVTITVLHNDLSTYQ